MSRKSVSRKSSRSPVPPLEKSTLDEPRLGLNNILQIDPWKDIDKYDEKEVGKIQKVLNDFKNMVVENKKNKRRSVEKNQRPTKIVAESEAHEETSRTKETIENDNKESSKNELNSSITIENNKTKDKSSGTRNSNSKPIAEPEEHLEGRREKCSKSKTHVELIVSLDDKKNKRKSLEKRFPSTSSSKTTNDVDLEEKTTTKKITRKDKKISCITDSSIDMLKNLSIDDKSDNQNMGEEPVEKDEEHPEEKTDKSFKSISLVGIDVLNEQKDKRNLVRKDRTSTSSSKAASNSNLEEETTKNKNVKKNKRESCINEKENLMKNSEDHSEERKENSSKSIHNAKLDVPNDKKNKRRSLEKMKIDAVQNWISESSVNDSIINVPESVATENSSNNQNTFDEERKMMRKENKDISSKVINREEPSSIGKRLISTSAMKTIVSNNSTEGQSTLDKEKFQYLLITSDGAGSIVDPEENIDSGHKRDDTSIERYEKKMATQKREKIIRDENISETVVEKIIDSGDTFTVQLPEISGSVSPASKKDKLTSTEAIEFQNYESSCDNDFVSNGSIISGHLNHNNSQIFSSTSKIETLDSEFKNIKNSVLQKNDELTKQSTTMKPRSVSAEPETKNSIDFNDNKSESKNNSESEKNDVVTNQTELSVKQLPTTKARSASAERVYTKFIACKNNELGMKNAKQKKKKIAEAFEKFSKKFVKYSKKIEEPQEYDIGPNDVTIDSESDSSSSSSNSTYSNSSDHDESSPFSDTSSSSCTCSGCEASDTSSSSCTCSGCEGSSGTSYTSYSSQDSPCSCGYCCEKEMYSEYTLASSSSCTDSNSDYSSDSVTD